MSNFSKKRSQIRTKLDLLKDDVPSFRTRTMNKEFGPYWYYLLDVEDQPILSPRYKQWQSDCMKETNALKLERKARVQEFFNKHGGK
jgi:hypothetical protein